MVGLLAMTTAGFLWWIVSAVVWVVLIYLVYKIAVTKGRSPFLWVVLALFLPLISLIIVLILPARSRPPA